MLTHATDDPVDGVISHAFKANPVSGFFRTVDDRCRTNADEGHETENDGREYSDHGIGS